MHVPVWFRYELLSLLPCRSRKKPFSHASQLVAPSPDVVNGLEHGLHTDEPSLDVCFPVCVEWVAYVIEMSCMFQDTFIVKQNELYLALVTLALSSVGLSASSWAGIASGGALCLLELTSSACDARIRVA